MDFSLAKPHIKITGRNWSETTRFWNAPQHPPPLHPFWKGRGGNAPAMPPFSGVAVRWLLHATR